MKKAPVVVRMLVLALSTAALWPTASDAQQLAKVPRVGFLTPGQTTETSPPGLVRKYLRDLGYVNGQNVIYELRAADGHPERLPDLADELVRMKVDVIYAFTSPAAFVAKSATSSIPIVAVVHAALDTGLVKSLARPGGNVTGVETLAAELDAKRLELLKEIVPGLTKVGVLYNPADQGTPFHLKSVQAAGRTLRVGVVPLEVRQPEDFDVVFSPAAGKAFDALVTFTDAWLTSGHWKRAADFALAHRIPTACEFRFYAQLGCLIAYGTTLDEFAQRNARQIDLILKGAKPAELPFEQVTRFELLVNMKTARALGVTIPQPVLLRADEVIE